MSSSLSGTRLADARRRHPSSRWPAPRDGLHLRVAQHLELHGSRHADIAASVLEARGRTGACVESFAWRLGVDADVIRQAEAGELGATELPLPVRRLL